eukprot:GEMP01038708.1.p1 GENE.GEMP01038708.1~~GEMP01038708.1.p1  ORF type:complete len:420 (+),score=75.95 GEMP01038708.1:126-1385(+)
MQGEKYVCPQEHVLREADRHRAAEYELLELRVHLLREEKTLEIEKQRTLEAERLQQEALNFTPINLIIERNVDYLMQELEKQRFETEQLRKREVKLVDQLRKVHEECERMYQCSRDPRAKVVEDTKEVPLENSSREESPLPEEATYSESPTASTLASCTNDDRDMLSAGAQGRFKLTPPNFYKTPFIRLPTIVSAPTTPQMDHRDCAPGINPTPRGTVMPLASTTRFMTQAQPQPKTTNILTVNNFSVSPSIHGQSIERTAVPSFGAHITSHANRSSPQKIHQAIYPNVSTTAAAPFTYSITLSRPKIGSPLFSECRPARLASSAGETDAPMGPTVVNQCNRVGDCSGTGMLAKPRNPVPYASPLLRVQNMPRLSLNFSRNIAPLPPAHPSSFGNIRSRMSGLQITPRYGIPSFQRNAS